MAGNSGVSAVVVQPFGALGVGNWWEEAGVPCNNVWAYRAINSVGTPWPGGPTIYADTLVNLVNPGVNDLVEGPIPGVPVPWNVLIGWQFVAAALRYFVTGLIPTADQSWTALVQFTNAVYDAGGNTILGVNNPGASARFRLIPRAADTWVGYYNGANILVPPVHATGNVGVVGNRGYRDGFVEGAVIGGWLNPSLFDVYFGAVNNLGAPSRYITVNFESAWIGDCVLTPTQVLDIVTAQSQL